METGNSCKEAVATVATTEARAEVVEVKLDLGVINRSAAARALRVDVAHISRVLNGKRNPSLKLAKKMADYLHVSLDQLYAAVKVQKQRVENEKQKQRRAGKQGIAATVVCSGGV